MLRKNQIEEIRKHLDNAQNPLFFFDNDSDGLCSFLLLQRHSKKGKGIPIRSFPEMGHEYFRKVNELKSDYIFILDKPRVSKEFFEEAGKFNIPIVWIDHHDVQVEIPSFVNYYSSFDEFSKKSVPTTYMCYQVSQEKKDLWIAVAGCISDKFVPAFYKDFLSQNPDLAISSSDAFEIFYNSGIGKIAKILNFALKDKTTNVISMLKYLMNVNSPYDLLKENNQNYSIHKRFNQINKAYQRLIIKAKASVKKNDKILFFQYKGDLSMSSDLSNELSFLFPKKFVIVAYVTGIKANISVRGNNVKDISLKSIDGLEGSRGGGHKDAVGVQVMAGDIENFRKNFQKFSKYTD